MVVGPFAAGLRDTAAAALSFVEEDECAGKDI
jgi:hypothetical protein